jgi:hypothetical protein
MTFGCKGAIIGDSGAQLSRQSTDTLGGSMFCHVCRFSFVILITEEPEMEAEGTAHYANVS